MYISLNIALSMYPFAHKNKLRGDDDEDAKGGNPNRRLLNEHQDV